MEREALFDPTGVYRYLLRRTWDDARPLIVFVMLNPSTADARKDDPTIRRCMGLARSWEFGRLEVVNLFGFRTPYPRILREVPDPVGPDNDAHVLGAVKRAEAVVAAWGNAGAMANRGPDMLVRMAEIARAPLQCLGLTRTGQPRHPLYVASSVQKTHLTFY
jgi:hypothetical protein